MWQKAVVLVLLLLLVVVVMRIVSLVESEEGVGG